MLSHWCGQWTCYCPLCQQQGLGQRKLCVLAELSGALLKLQGTLAPGFKNCGSRWPRFAQNSASCTSKHKHVLGVLPWWSGLQQVARERSASVRERRPWAKPALWLLMSPPGKRSGIGPPLGPSCMHGTAPCSRELSSPCFFPGSTLNGWNQRISLISHTNESIGVFFFFFFFVSEEKFALCYHLVSIVLRSFKHFPLGWLNCFF